MLGEYCSFHGFIHGAEAEEFRQKIEELADELTSRTYLRSNTEDGSKISADTIASELRMLLDKVDARDSVAFLETRAGKASRIGKKKKKKKKR